MQQDKSLHRFLIKRGYKKNGHDYYNGRNVIVVSNKKIIDFYTISNPLIKDIKTLVDIAYANTVLYYTIDMIYIIFGKEVFTPTLQKDFEESKKLYEKEFGGDENESKNFFGFGC